MKSKFVGLKEGTALILLILTAMFSSCKNNPDYSQEKVNYLYNQKNPLKGEIDLKLEKRFEIDPSRINPSGDLLFDNFWHDSDGSIYIFDYKNFKIYKFDSEGKELCSFLSKGEGPFEALTYPQLQLSENFVWVIADKKIIKFRKNGEPIKEYKLKSFYFSIQILDEDRFLAFELISLAKIRDDGRYSKNLSLYDLNTEQRLKTIFSSPYTGRLYIKTGNTSMAVIPDPGIVPDIIYAFDLRLQRIYIAENQKYNINVKNFNGDLIMVFSRPTANPLISENDKNEIAESITTIPTFIKLIKDALPKQLCSIEKIFSFANGYIGVVHIKGYKRFELDIFDTTGRFVYLIKFPVDFKAYEFKVYEDTLGVLCEKGDIMVYREYFITTLKGNTIMRNAGTVKK